VTLYLMPMDCNSEVGFAWAGIHVWPGRLGVGKLRCAATVGSQMDGIRHGERHL
jgi:hypothetical protein